MRNSPYPIWVFVVAAFATALAAFGTAQLWEGAGVFVAAAGSLMWAAWVGRKGAIMREKNG